MSGSAFEGWREHTSNFAYNSQGYYTDRQQKETTKPNLSRGLVQGVSSIEQQRFSELLVSTLGQSPEVITQLVASAGPGVGSYYALPMPGSNVVIHRAGNQRYNLGSKVSGLYLQEVYSYKKAKKRKNVILPPAFADILKSPQISKTVGSVCTMPTNLGLNRLDVLSLVPGPSESLSWHTGKKTSHSPFGNLKTRQKLRNFSFAPLGSATDYLSGEFNSKRAALCTQNYLQGDNFLHLIDPISKEVLSDDKLLDPATPLAYTVKEVARTPNPAYPAGKDYERRLRANQFKNEALQQIKDQVNALVDSEYVRNNLFPKLQKLADDAWTNDILDRVFKLAVEIESNPTYQFAADVVKKVNRFLPYVQRVTDILAPLNKPPLLVTSGVSIEPGALIIKPDYSETIRLINNYLPEKLKISIDDAGLHLKQNTYLVQKNTPFVFTDEFKSYVKEVNKYLAGETKWLFGLGEPPKVLALVKGIAISVNEGLLLQDQAVDLSQILKANVGCNVPAENKTEVTVVDQKITLATDQVEAPQESEESKQLKAQLFSQLSNTVYFKNGKVEFDIKALASSAIGAVNSILPPTLQVDAILNSNGSLRDVKIGPLVIKAKPNGGWAYNVKDIKDIQSGIDVVDSLGIIPPDITYLFTASLKLKSLYEEAKADFVDAFSTKQAPPPPPVIPQGTSVEYDTVNYETGEIHTTTTSAEPVIPPQPEEPLTSILPETAPEGTVPATPPPEIHTDPNDTPIWAEEFDSAQSLIGGGYLDKVIEGRAGDRGITVGSILPIIAFGEKIFGGKGDASSSAQSELGRSDAGLSLQTGTIASKTGTNYALLSSLCYDNATLEVTNEINPLDNQELDNVISGLELALDNFATPVKLVITDFIDPQSTRDALEQYLVEIGLGETASNGLDALDNFLYPPIVNYVDVELTNSDDLYSNNPDEIIDTEIFLEEQPRLDDVEFELQEIDKDFNGSIDDLIEVIQSVSDIDTQQVLSGILIGESVSNAEKEVNKVIKRRISFRLDCDSTNYFKNNANAIQEDKDFPKYAENYGIAALPSKDYTLNPVLLLDIIKKTEPKLVPAVERLLTGNLFGFWRQLIWAKTGNDIYHSPVDWTRLNMLTRSYYGGAVPSSNPTREWLKQISGI